MQAAHVDHVELPQHPVQHPVQANQMLAVQHPPAGQPHEEDEEEEDDEEEVVVEPYYQSNEHGGLNDDAKLQQVLDIIHQDETFLWVGDHHVDEHFHAKYGRSRSGIMTHRDGFEFCAPQDCIKIGIRAKYKIPKHWPVVYHGTKAENLGSDATSILMSGFSIDRGVREAHGKGLYMTPSFRLAQYVARPHEVPDGIFDHGPREVRTVLQLRVNPDVVTAGRNTFCRKDRSNMPAFEHCDDKLEWVMKRHLLREENLAITGIIFSFLGADLPYDGDRAKRDGNIACTCTVCWKPVGERKRAREEEVEGGPRKVKVGIDIPSKLLPLQRHAEVQTTGPGEYEVHSEECGRDLTSIVEGVRQIQILKNGLCGFKRGDLLFMGDETEDGLGVRLIANGHAVLSKDVYGLDWRILPEKDDGIVKPPLQISVEVQCDLAGYGPLVKDRVSVGEGGRDDGGASCEIKDLNLNLPGARCAKEIEDYSVLDSILSETRGVRILTDVVRGCRKGERRYVTGPTADGRMYLLISAEGTVELPVNKMGVWFQWDETEPV